MVPEFCYLGDMLSAGGGCELAAVTRCKSAWGTFRQSATFDQRSSDKVSSDSLLSKLGLQDIEEMLCSCRMRWYGHVECSKGWIAQVRKLNIVAQK